ncbi:DUF551 domain-containing protein [Chryseobacterium sp.]|uniref:DUF551 domain-containing protein n=1 Tax=Chryseobacterium sp. TaxID=1871047 RepID=UPI000EC3FB13|nr:DUF551 domain-containing protein [Chryseobacterium sp.]HCM34142.1 hypothetical protein [Chryseobacterium sp.]
MWTEIIKNEDLPEQGTKVIGFSKEWIDEDFNPDGTRECFHCGLDVITTEWISAKWCNYHDCWHDDTKTTPSHWMPYPKPPINLLKPI